MLVLTSHEPVVGEGPGVMSKTLYASVLGLAVRVYLLQVLFMISKAAKFKKFYFTAAVLYNPRRQTNITQGK